MENGADPGGGAFRLLKMHHYSDLKCSILIVVGIAGKGMAAHCVTKPVENVSGLLEF